MIERSRVRIPAGRAGECSSPGSTFCADSYFGIHSTPRVTTVARKRSRSFCQKCRWQVTAKHAYTLSPFLTGRMFVRPNILRTLRRTMIRFLIEHLVRRIWFGQSRLYFILNWLVMRCKLRPELAADAQQTA